MDLEKKSLKEIFIYCAGGQGRHIAWLIQQIGGYNILGFIDESFDQSDKILKGIKVFSSIEHAFSLKSEVKVAIANGTPRTVYNIVKKLKNYEIENDCQINFPNLIHPSVLYDADNVKFGVGNIINVGTNFTTDVDVGNFNYFNRYCVLGHDLVVGDYCNFNAGVIIGGNVTIGDFSYLGMGSRVIQGKTIGKNVLLAAGCVIQKDVVDNACMIMPMARYFRTNKQIEK